MTDNLLIEPLDQAFSVSLCPPGSKSLTNRAVLLAALSSGRCDLSGLLCADDAHRMREALITLGINWEATSPTTASITGNSGTFPKADAKLLLGNAGTATRFLTAACCLGTGVRTLDGIPRMRERPIGQLVDPLRELGANIDYQDHDGFPPLQIKAGGIHGGKITLQPTLSSQYISALLQIAPYLPGGLTIDFDGQPISIPYITMTLSLMHQFGIKANIAPGFTSITVPQGVYKPVNLHIEPDASNASYFLAAAAITPASKCTIKGLGFRSVQGDAGFAEVLQLMGASVICEPDSITVISPPKGEKLVGIDIDLNHMPDMAQTLAAVAYFADGPTTIRNVGNLRVKETDRMAAIQVELMKLGAEVDIEGDDIIITPPVNPMLPADEAVTINTYDDHRMAMSFAVIGLRKPGVVLQDPTCVNKTFPDFYDYLTRLRG
ncbi:MAG: 3-phosphoshikimate 1-carboxyvinyltransferase [Phycisphaeraceae bacterium]|nr:3-phosphoshikimate 1-carboxyvinyltransferase [Phycisphaeraceae bacterium]